MWLNINGNWIGRHSGQSWQTYWTSLISAVIAQADQDAIVLTFPSAKSVVIGDFSCTVNGSLRTLNSLSWTGAVLTIVASSDFAYEDVVVLTFKTSNTVNVTNNITHPLVIEDGNTEAWYVFDDLTTITKNAGTGEVSAWKDKLGSGHDLLQADAGRYPVWNATTGITFDGINDFLKTAIFTLNQPVFIYAIIKQITWTNGDRIWSGYGNDYCALTQLTASPNLVMYALPSGDVSNNNATLGFYHVLRCLYNGANSAFQVDDTTKVIGSLNTQAAAGFTLGKIGTSSSSYSNFSVSEIIIRKVADSAGDETVIYNYLAKRKLFFLNNYDKILVLGNSITIHPIVSYWWGEWGMAASVRENDFVHRLQSKIRLVNPDCEITPVNISAWEQAHTTYDKSNLDTYFTTPPNLVILRIGENVSDLTDFDISIQGLIDYVKLKAPSANIVMTGTFFAYAAMNVLLSTAAIANGLPYTELSSLRIPANQSSIGATVYDEDGNPHLVNSNGVAQHPNDAGMDAIADKIYGILS